MIHSVVETARLVLSPAGQRDIDLLHGMWTNPDVRRYLWDDQVIPRDRAAEAIATSSKQFTEEKSGLWVVRVTETQKAVGFGGYLYVFDPPELQIVFGLVPAHWGQGYATEIAGATIRYGFDTLGLERVIGATDAPNTASSRVMERCGMSLSDRRMADGLDTLFYAVDRAAFTGWAAPYGVRQVTPSDPSP